jgi:hypothetical protein
MPAAAWLPLILFAGLIAAAALQLLAASGQFPAEHRSDALRDGAGPVILFGSMLLVLLCVLGGIVGIWQRVPWYAAVIGGGLAVLIAPMLLKPLPDDFVNGRGALVAFALVCAALTAALLLTH